MGEKLIEEIVELRIMGMIRDRLNDPRIVIAGFWQTTATGAVKMYFPPLLTVSLTPFVNETPGVPRYKTSVTIVLTLPRGQDNNAAWMVETCRNLLPFINSFAGVCNETVKTALSNDTEQPLYSVSSILDENSDNTFHRESDNWVVVRGFTMSIMLKK
jgi:hypothetical protein